MVFGLLIDVVAIEQLIKVLFDAFLNILIIRWYISRYTFLRLLQVLLLRFQLILLFQSHPITVVSCLLGIFRRCEILHRWLLLNLPGSLLFFPLFVD